MSTSLAKFDSTVTMSSLEIAELTDKNHANVMRDIRKMLDELEQVAIKFDGYYTASNGKQNPLFNLPYRETMILVSGYSVELRAKVVDRWMELEKKVAPQIQPMLPDQLERQCDSLQRINSNNYTAINPNIIQLMRDAAQNNLMLALGASSSVIPSKQHLIIGVIEIAKKYLNVNLQKHGVSLGKYVAMRIRLAGGNITKVERICTGEMRTINGYDEPDHAQIVEYIEDWIMRNPTLN